MKTRSRGSGLLSSEVLTRPTTPPPLGLGITVRKAWCRTASLKFVSYASVPVVVWPFVEEALNCPVPGRVTVAEEKLVTVGSRRCSSASSPGIRSCWRTAGLFSEVLIAVMVAGVPVKATDPPGGGTEGMLWATLMGGIREPLLGTEKTLEPSAARVIVLEPPGL